jgi:hypothetical protein
VASRAGVDRRAAVGRVLGDVWRDVEVTQIIDDLLDIGSLVGSEGEAARSGRMAHHHRHGCLAFDGSCRRAELGLDHQPVAVLGQRIADVGKLDLLAFALAIEPGCRIGGRSMRVVAARLAVEVALAVAAARRRLVRAVLDPEALRSSSSTPTPQPACRRREVFVRQETAHLFVVQQLSQELVCAFQGR